MTTFLVLDTETDFVRPFSHHSRAVIQVAAAFMNDAGEIVEEIEAVVSPTHRDGAPLDVSEIDRFWCGLRGSEVMQGKPFREVTEPIREMLGRADFMVGHNMSFDLSVMADNIQRTGESEHWIVEKPRLCTMRSLIPYMFENRKAPSLSEVHAAMFGFGKRKNAHDAMSDVHATCEIVRYMMDNGIRFRPALAGPVHSQVEVGEVPQTATNPNLSFKLPSVADTITTILDDDWDAANLTGALAGKKVVFTGKLMFASRAGMTVVARKMGATVTGSVSKKTDLLVVGENPGSKLAKAKTLGVQVMTEDEWFAEIEAYHQSENADAEPLPA